MKFVPEKIIDATIEQLDKSDIFYEKKMADFAEKQPVVIAWLYGESFELLTDDEKGYLQYLALIVHESFLKINPEVDMITEDEIGETEEKNFTILELQVSPKFRDRLDPFFKDHPQEDLLAMIEDAVMEEDDMLTKEGREPIFIALKTLVDCLQFNG
jgi:hypothetical protein